MAYDFVDLLKIIDLKDLAKRQERNNQEISRVLEQLLTYENVTGVPTNTTVTENKAIWDRANNITAEGKFLTSKLQGAIEALTNQINAGSGTVTITEDDGILIVDNAETPTKALRLLGGIFAIADSKDEGGNWEWRTFGTGDGFTADLLTSGKILTTLINIVGDKYYTKILGDGLRVYNKDGYLAGHFGHYETLAAQLSTFTRASAAYKQDGSSVASGMPRYEYTRQPAPVWQDLFDTDQLASKYTSGGDTPGTPTIAGGLLSYAGGTNATLIKNDLLLQNCEIEINSDQAQDGGIVARWQDNNNYYLLALRDDSGVANNLQLYKRVGGTLTSLATADVTWARGTSKPIKFTLHGSHLEAYFDGVKVISITDTTFTGGGVGPRNHSSTAFRVLDFSVYHVQQGVMVEERTTNVCPYSEELDNATWNKANVTVTPNATTAPNGTATADLLAATAGVSSSVWRNLTVSSEVLYTVSAFVKRSNNDRFKILAHDTVGSAHIAGGHWDVDVDGDITSARIQLGSGFVGYKEIVDGWWRIWMTFTTPSTGLRVYLFVDEWDATSQGNSGYIWGAQVEQKAYITSYIRTAGASASRAAEVITVPTAGVFNKGNWAIEGVYVPQIPMNIGSVEKILWYLYIDSNNFYYFCVSFDGAWILYVKSGGTLYTVTGGNPTQGNAYRWQISGNGAILRLCVNGEQIGVDTAYVEPVGSLPANMYIGSNLIGSGQCNGILGDIRISNIARTLAQHQADYNTGLPFSVDEYTTYLMSCDGHLRPTVRKFGLWVGQGEVNSALIKGSQIYGTEIRSGNQGDTTYIQLSASGYEPLLVVENGKEALSIWTFDGGLIQFFDTALDDMVGQILPYNDVYGQGLRIQGRNNAGARKTIHLDALVLNLNGAIGVNLNSGTGYFDMLGDVSVSGDLSCTGAKPAIHQTVNYGRRAMYARESPNLKFVEESVGQLVNGEARIELDPIFLETIEPNNDLTPWSVFLTAYADIELYVAEIGVNYFIVRERSSGTSNSKFAWSLSGYRQGFAHLRMKEYVLDTDVLETGWEDALLQDDPLIIDKSVLESNWEDELL